jgi:hypothetical protein
MPLSRVNNAKTRLGVKDHVKVYDGDDLTGHVTMQLAPAKPSPPTREPRTEEVPTPSPSAVDHSTAAYEVTAAPLSQYRPGD